jgi:hypothetical protein
LSSSSFTGSPDPRLRPFGPGHAARYPASYPAPLAEEPAIMVPVSCCLSATGLGLSGHPVPARELGLPHGRLTGRAAPGPGRGFHVPHQRDTTGMGASSTPGTAVLSRPDAVPGQRLPLPSGQSLNPATDPTAGLLITRHQRRFTRFTRPACPSPVIPGWDGNPRAFPCAPHPAVTGDARQGGAGREHAPATTRPT